VQDLVFETFGLSQIWFIQRNHGILLLRLRPIEIDVDLKVLSKLSCILIDDRSIEGVPVRIYYPLSSIDNKNELLSMPLFIITAQLLKISQL